MYQQTRHPRLNKCFNSTPGYCVVGGDSAYHTFDGSYYSLPPPGEQTQCGERILTQSSAVIKGRSKFVVTHTVEPCADDATSACLVGVKLVHNQKTYSLRKNLTVRRCFVYNQE